MSNERAHPASAVMPNFFSHAYCNCPSRVNCGVCLGDVNLTTLKASLLIVRDPHDYSLNVALIAVFVVTPTLRAIMNGVRV